jgi:hypothetical protein
MFALVLLAEAASGPDWPQSILGGLTALVVATAAAMKAYNSLIHRDDVTDKRVDLLWQAHLRRGAVEGVNERFIVPLPDEPSGESIFMRFGVRPQVVEAFKPLAPVLKDLWREAKGDEVKFAELLEERHGPWLQKHICLVLGVKEYACIEMAKLVACGAPIVPVTNGPALTPGAA